VSIARGETDVQPAGKLLARPVVLLAGQAIGEGDRRGWRERTEVNETL
jgi:hypothetical protein